MSSDAGGDGWEGRQWDDMVERCAAVVDRLRTNNDIRRADDEDGRGAAELTRALEEIVALIADDEEYVPALGAARGHPYRPAVTHRVPEVASAAADAMEACAGTPSRRFLPRAATSTNRRTRSCASAPSRHLSRSARHVREVAEAREATPPNIAWDSGLVLARWMSRHPELVAGSPSWRSARGWARRRWPRRVEAHRRWHDGRGSVGDAQRGVQRADELGRARP